MMKKKICGFGINDSVENTRCDEENYKLYCIWADFIRRCYSAKSQLRMPTYIGCTVDERWRYFTAFKSWAVNQDWKGKHLDKDLLSPDGFKKYGPDTCVFIEPEVNQFMKGDQKQGIDNGLPAGIHWSNSKGKFVAQSGSNPRKHLGYFNCPEMAHNAYVAYRKNKAVEISNRISDNNVKSAFLLKYTSEVIL